MPFRTTFACLWCGRPHTVRDADDIEGWAQLCPDCLGRAGDNGFLRFRLRAALEERGRARAATAGGPARGAVTADAGEGGTSAGALATHGPIRPAPGDDWYLRLGGHSRGTIEDALWAADLDAATLWLDGLPLAGRIVEPVAGEGWWSPLLAGKGELWAYDADAAALDRARDRLVAHGLRAHLHPRDSWTEPDRPGDWLVTAFWLGRLGERDRPTWLELARRWLRPDGRYALLELAPGAAGPGADGPAALEPDELHRLLLATGFEPEAGEVGGSILRVVTGIRAGRRRK